MTWKNITEEGLKTWERQAQLLGGPALDALEKVKKRGEDSGEETEGQEDSESGGIGEYS